MKQFLYLFVIMPFLARTQVTQTIFKKAEGGIHWTEELIWEQVKAKARSEKKYIFVDCYASWCGPCKLMDKNVYTNEKIGKIANEKLIAVKIQFDSTSDDQAALYWFSVGNMLRNKYKIAGYPTFSFPQMAE